MSATIYLADIAHKFSPDGRRVCAVCGYDFDAVEDDARGPLLLWRKNGMEMLALCLEPCASDRIRPGPSHCETGTSAQADGGRGDAAAKLTEWPRLPMPRI